MFKIKGKKFFNNMKLGIKLIIGFIILILLAGFMGGISYYGINNIVDKVNKENSADNIVKYVLEARKAEIAFINSGEQQYADIIEKNITSIKDEAVTINEQFKLKSNKQLMNKIIEHANEYENIFNNLKDYKKQQSLLTKRMFEEGDNLFKAAETIRSDQKIQYNKLININSDFKDVNEKLLISEDANNIIIFVKDSKISALNYIKTGDLAYKYQSDSELYKIKTKLDGIKSDYELQDREIQQINDMNVILNSYKQAYEDYTIIYDKEKEEIQKIIEAAETMQ